VTAITEVVYEGMQSDFAAIQSSAVTPRLRADLSNQKKFLGIRDPATTEAFKFAVSFCTSMNCARTRLFGN